MALKLHGCDDNLHRSDFRAFATTAGLKASDADDAINEIVQKMTAALKRTALPKGLDCGKEGESRIQEMLDICRSRLMDFPNRNRSAKNR